MYSVNNLTERTIKCQEDPKQVITLSKIIKSRVVGIHPAKAA